ncbi:MAG: carboxypeptidase-like regulatory domain-containing protein [Bacteroides cellulosilyticus]
MMVSALYAGYPQDAFATVNEVQAVMQSNPVKGQVVDENGDPVIGATVMMKGTSKGAITDLNGNFTLENAAKGTLVISYIGYITEEVQTNGQASVKVVLKEDAKRLDEVVVIGYGTQRKEELTSSVMSVKASEFVQATKPDVAGLIRGKVAGLAVFRLMPIHCPLHKFRCVVLLRSIQAPFLWSSLMVSREISTAFLRMILHKSIY